MEDKSVIKKILEKHVSLNIFYQLNVLLVAFCSIANITCSMNLELKVDALLNANMSFN